MPAWDSKTDPAIQRFWDKYIIILEKQGIKPAQHRWHVRRIEQYISHYSDQKLVTHSPEQVSSYLHMLGRQRSLERLAVCSITVTREQLFLIFVLVNIATQNINIRDVTFTGMFIEHTSEHTNERSSYR